MTVEIAGKSKLTTGQTDRQNCCYRCRGCNTKSALVFQRNKIVVVCSQRWSEAGGRSLTGRRTHGQTDRHTDLLQQVSQLQHQIHADVSACEIYIDSREELSGSQDRLSAPSTVTNTGRTDGQNSYYRCRTCNTKIYI